AKALAERQPPRAIDAAAEWRMDHQLHAARFVEEALEHDRLMSRQTAERRVCRREVCDDLCRCSFGDADLVHQPHESGLGAALQSLFDLSTQTRNCYRQLIRASGCFAEPERNRRRFAARILDPHDTALDANDPIRSIAELEHVAGQALDREVFVYGADQMAFWFEHHLIVGSVWNRAAGGDRRQPRALARTNHAIHRIVIQQCAVPAATRG